MTTVLLALCLIASLAACVGAFLAWRAASAQPQGPSTADLIAELRMLQNAVNAAPRDIRDDLAHDRQGRSGELEALSTGLFTKLSFNARDTLEAMKDLRERTEASLKGLSEKVEGLAKDGATQAEAMREKVRLELETLRTGNEKKLEEMRVTVDEKLQGALNERLDQSFKQVSERLEAVHKGLGEMQTLATGVGDLKRVLTNVKTRGTWGEVQLGSLLEDLLTPEQFSRQARVRPDSGEVVDFVIHLPETLLPIDCKYPQEDYERLVAAQEAGDPVLVEACGKALERALRVQAKSINEKYVHPPHSHELRHHVPADRGAVRRGRAPLGLRAGHPDHLPGDSGRADHALGAAQQPAHGLHDPGDPEEVERDRGGARPDQDRLRTLRRGAGRGGQGAGRGQEEGRRRGRAPSRDHAPTQRH